MKPEISQRDVQSLAGNGCRFQPLEVRQLVDQVYEALRRSMLDGELRPGERLDTRRLAQDFGVSQSPVRRAVAMLAKDGLIEIRPRSGTFVGSLSATHMAEIMDIRRALELLACENAVKLAAEKDILSLRRLVQGIRESVDPRDVSQAAARQHDLLNSAFHESFVKLSGNRQLVQLYNTLEFHQHMARVHARYSVWGRSVATEAEQHGAIVDALEKRDLEGLCQRVQVHVRYSRALLMKGMIPKDQKVTRMAMASFG